MITKDHSFAVLVDWRQYKKFLVWLIACFFVPCVFVGGFFTLAQWFDDLDKPYADPPKMAFDCLVSFITGGSYVGFIGLLIGVSIIALGIVAMRLLGRINNGRQY